MSFIKEILTKTAISRGLMEPAMIVNRTTKKVLAEYHRTYEGLMQAKGLMFSRKKGAVFPSTKAKRMSVHTWFVFYPIDLLFLDTEMRVVEMKENMRPFSSYSSKKEASCLVELPSQLGKDVSVGDIIRFK